MKRIVGAAIVAAALLAPSTVFAGFSYTPRDVVLGAGQLTSPNGQPNNNFVIAAVSGPNGEQPRGVAGYWVVLEDQGGLTYFAGSPECLRVSGRQASMVIDLSHTRNQPTKFLNGGAVIRVQDNGFGSWKKPVDLQQNNRLTPDELNSLRDSTGKVQCPAPDAPVGGAIKGPFVPIFSGDTFVYDAPGSGV